MIGVNGWPVLALYKPTSCHPPNAHSGRLRTFRRRRNFPGGAQDQGLRDVEVGKAARRSLVKEQSD